MIGQISNSMKLAYKVYSRGPRYRLSLALGQRPEWLSKIMHGLTSVQLGDPRVLEAAKMLGLHPDQAFEKPRCGDPGGHEED